MVFLVSTIILSWLQQNFLSHPPQSTPRKHWEQISSQQRDDGESDPDSANHWPTIHPSSAINQCCRALTQLLSGRAWQCPGGSSPSPTVAGSVQTHLTWNIKQTHTNISDIKTETSPSATEKQAPKKHSWCSIRESEETCAWKGN